MRVVIVYFVAVVEGGRMKAHCEPARNLPRAIDHRHHHQPLATKLSLSCQSRCIVTIVTSTPWPWQQTHLICGA